MKRVIVCVAVLVVALWTCFVGRPTLVGSADASDDPLTTETKAQIELSLIVFSGEITKVGPAPTAGVGGPTRRWVAYKIERVLKGACFESELTVEYLVPAGRDPNGGGLDPAVFAPGKRVVVGAQLCRRERPTYALQCAPNQLAPVIWTQAFEDAVARYVERGPGVTTISKTVIVNALAGQQRATCMNNLSQLGQVHLIQTMENRAKAQKYSGPAMWLAMRKSGVEIHRGEERTVLCPCDLDVYVPATDTEIKRWDDVDLAKPAEGLCSYAGRDFVKFPIDVKSTDKQAIGACLHHDGGAVVVFDGGDAYFMTLEELGLASEAEKTVGPESKSPVLRVLR